MPFADGNAYIAHINTMYDLNAADVWGPKLDDALAFAKTTKMEYRPLLHVEWDSPIARIPAAKNYACVFHVVAGTNNNYFTIVWYTWDGVTDPDNVPDGGNSHQATLLGGLPELQGENTTAMKALITDLPNRSLDTGFPY